MSSRINVGKVAPIPKGNWVQSQSYEKLNMVNNGGVLYIAKEDVPADTAITNTNYWMPASGKFSIGTIETVSSSTGASATIIDGAEGPILNLNIPRGVTGNESIDDTKGEGDTDYVWSADKIESELTFKAPVILSNASGSIASFTDGSPAPVTALSVNIEPAQDLHNYDAPWPGGSGANLISDVPNTDNGYVFGCYIKSDGELVVSTGSSGPAYYVCEYCPCEPDTDYTCKKYRTTATNAPAICFYDSNKQYISGEAYNGRTSYTVTSPSNAAYFRTTQDNPNIANNVKRFFFVTKGTTLPDTWEPYSNVCPISGWTSCNIYLEDAYDAQATPKATIDLGGTRYGGMLDVLTGTMAITKVCRSISNIGGWIRETSANNRFRTDAIQSVVKLPPSNSVPLEGLMCEVYTTREGAAPGSGRVNLSIAVTSTGYLAIRDEAYSTVESWLEAVGNYLVVYPLAEPQTIPLTPSQIQTLLGENHIWADTGDIMMEYRADSKLYIDQAIAESQKATRSMITTVADSMVAPTNLTNGQIIIVGDDIYKLTTNISSGANLVVGTNCQKATLAEWVTALTA